MSYTIRSVNSRREWDSRYGPMVSYDIDLTDPSGMVEANVELAQKRDTPAPQAGQTLDGEIERGGKFGPKFKKAHQDRGGGGGGGGGGRQRDPNERNSIERQVAFKGAVDLVVALSSGENPNLDSDSTKSALTGFFNHGLALIQGQTPPPAPGLHDPASTDARKNGTAISPMEGALAELRVHLNAWNAPNAGEVWENKLASMGLKSPTEANDAQIELLIAFAKERAEATAMGPQELAPAHGDEDVPF